MASTRVAVVTGSNQGIGFAIVRGLCKQFKGDVYLTSRDESRGKAAVAELEKEGFHPHFHQLNIDDKQSIENLKKFIVDKYGGLDLLVNNAGIAYKQDSTAPFAEQAEVTLRTNYWGTLHASEILFPILRPHSRVVQVSSMVTLMTLPKCSPELQQKLKSVKNFTELNTLMTKFVTDVKAGNHEAQGWPSSAYGVSKIGVTLMARLQQEQFDHDTRKDLIVNAVCPGYVSTNMSSYKGTKTIDEGAETPLMVALLPEGASSPKGKFLSEKTVKEY